ncbi:hypothetical protein [Streptomyces mirabilis]|uniref:hypothetical protein n=1 Tax=Streptomyces mirabilis TaxID=68239 RepID=UPI003685EABA
MKTVTMQDAEQDLAAATATLDQLKAKILDHGPGSVTAEELGHAALAVEHAKLTVQHAAQQTQAEAEAARQKHLHLGKEKWTADAGTPEKALEAIQQVAEGVAYLMSVCVGRQRLIGQAIAELRRAGVPRASEGAADQHAGLAWSEAGMGHSDTLHIDGRRIGNLNAGLLVGVAIARGCHTAGYSTNYLAPVLQVDATGVAVDAPEAWLRARY